jgi:hypothetical protein
VTRLELVLGCVLLFLLAVAGMRLGWRHRGNRQANLPPLPAVPAELAELPGSMDPELAGSMDLAPLLTGLYVGSTTATRWQDRIVARRLGELAAATARLNGAGVLIARQGSPDIFVPADRLVDARLEPALAGKVVGAGGLLVLRWQHGGQLLDTGLRADDKTGYPAWLAAVGELADRSPADGHRPEAAAS